MERDAVLEVSNLRVSADEDSTTFRILNGVGFTVGKGECVGLVGETGAGKSMTGAAAIGLLPTNCRWDEGEIAYAGQSFGPGEELGLGRLRGKTIATIVQNPLQALDPMKTVAQQYRRLIELQGKESKASAMRRCVRALSSVGVRDAKRVCLLYPHQLSGGMAQRVLIAFALANSPSMLIADEPTTGLDVVVQLQILKLLKSLIDDGGLSMVLISHDLGVIAHLADRVGVMFAGRIVEQGPADEIFRDPQHPYTRGLIKASLGFADTEHASDTAAAHTAEPPDLRFDGPGCAFAYRCPFRTAECDIGVPIRRSGEHEVACVNPQRGSL